MYKQERKAGWKQYIICLVAFILLWFLCDIAGAILQSPLMSDILFVVLSCITVYFVYSHYCAVFTYELTDKKIVLTRKIGSKTVVEEVALKKINAVTTQIDKQAFDNKMVNFRTSILSKKNIYYIIYNKNKNCLAFEPDANLLRILKENTND